MNILGIYCSSYPKLLYPFLKDRQDKIYFGGPLLFLPKDTISISQGQIRQGEMMKTHNTIGPNYLNNIASS
jgi:hypothetical protein